MGPVSSTGQFIQKREATGKPQGCVLGVQFLILAGRGEISSPMASHWPGLTYPGLCPGADQQEQTQQYFGGIFVLFCFNFSFCLTGFCLFVLLFGLQVYWGGLFLGFFLFLLFGREGREGERVIRLGG